MLLSFPSQTVSSYRASSLNYILELNSLIGVSVQPFSGPGSVAGPGQQQYFVASDEGGEVAQSSAPS